MSIDATVNSVNFYENGGGELRLLERLPGHPPGQSVLVFGEHPEEVSALRGKDVWGGDTSLMLGDMRIADRIGYTRIRFVEREKFLAALKACEARSAR
jgi:hypothetical protein